MKRRAFNHIFTKALIFAAAVSALFSGGVCWAEDWKPPLGIPAPEFGITQTHLMYAGQDFDYSTGSAPYKDAGNGPYSHYINVSAGNATDTANPYGTATLPRKTIPLNLPAGSVVEIHGGPYSTVTFNGNSIGVYGKGTAAKPIFIRGVPGALPTFSVTAIVFGSYLIYENLSFVGTAIVSHRPDLVPGGPADSDHLVFRHMVMRGTGANAGVLVAFSGTGQWNDPTKPWSRDFVFWDNTISDYGDWQSATENDSGGIVVGGFNAHNIWILNNTISHAGGDSVRIGSNPVTNYPTYTATNIYIGGNTFFDNGENCLDVKGCYNAVISQNVMHGGHATTSSSGTAIAFHYKCDNIWIVANTIYDAPIGISGSDGLVLYVIGNLIYDVGDGLNYWDSNNTIHMVGNTFARMNNGIYDVGQSSNPHPVINNIFTGLNSPTTGYHIKMNSASASNSEMKSNLIYEPGGQFRVSWGTLYTSLFALQAATGKGQDCLVSDPKFVDGQVNNFRLQPTSPAIDAAAIPSTYTALFASKFPGTSIARDLVGNLRPLGSSWDIGAFEFGEGEIIPDAPKNLRIISE